MEGRRKSALHLLFLGTENPRSAEKAVFSVKVLVKAASYPSEPVASIENVYQMCKDLMKFGSVPRSVHQEMYKLCLEVKSCGLVVDPSWPEYNQSAPTLEAVDD